MKVTFLRRRRYPVAPERVLSTSQLKCPLRTVPLTPALCSNVRGLSGEFSGPFEVTEVGRRYAHDLGDRPLGDLFLQKYSDLSLHTVKLRRAERALPSAHSHAHGRSLIPVCHCNPRPIHTTGPPPESPRARLPTGRYRLPATGPGRVLLTLPIVRMIGLSNLSPRAVG